MKIEEIEAEIKRLLADGGLPVEGELATSIFRMGFALGASFVTTRRNEELIKMIDRIKAENVTLKRKRKSDEN